MVNAAAMGDHVDFFLDGLTIIHHAHRFIGWVKAALQAFIMGGYPCRAGVLVTFQGLNTAQRKHETARGIDKIRAHTKSPSDIFGRH